MGNGGRRTSASALADPYVVSGTTMSRPGGHGFRTEKQESPERPRSPGPRALPLEAGGPPNQETQPNPGCGSQVDQGPRPQRQGARAHTWANVPIGQVQDDAHCPVLQEVLPLSCWVQNGTAVGTATLPAPKRCSLPHEDQEERGPRVPSPAPSFRPSGSGLLPGRLSVRSPGREEGGSESGSQGPAAQCKSAYHTGK